VSGAFQELPDHASIGRELLESGLVDTLDGLRLEPMPRNPARLDFGERSSFRVWAGDSILCHLTAGPGLSDLAERTRSFAETCPDIACRFIFFRQSPSGDILTREFFAGLSLDSLVRAGRLSLAQATACAARVQTALEATSRPSTPEAAAREFESFQAEVLASKLFSDRDRDFLREFILPFIRTGLLAGPLTTRWTNGDFVPPNVLVGSDGQVRLVDPEFAGRTHFHAEDRWRWRAFAELSPEGLEFPTTDASTSLQPWIEAYAILRQLVLSHRINTRPFAAAVADHFSERLVQLAAQPGSHHRLAEFLARALQQPSLHAGPGPAAKPVTAQLFWSTDGLHSENCSQKVAYIPGREETLRFVAPAVCGTIHLRLDPADRPGSLEIFSLRVVAGTDTLFDFSPKTGWAGLHFERGLLQIPAAQNLSLQCLDDDPILLLPSTDAGPLPRDLVCEVTLRFVRHALELPGLISA